MLWFDSEDMKSRGKSDKYLWAASTAYGLAVRAEMNPSMTIKYNDRGDVTMAISTMQTWLGVDDDFIRDTELDDEAFDPSEEDWDVATNSAILHCAETEFGDVSLFGLPQTRVEVRFVTDLVWGDEFPHWDRSYAVLTGKFSDIFRQLDEGRSDTWGL